VQDHDKLELAVTGLPMFAFPNGMRLTLADAGQFPLPLFFTFVFTDADGKHFYVACLQFYEPVTEADLQETFCKVHGEDQVLLRFHWCFASFACFALVCDGFVRPWFSTAV
jgi:hypothetical protein